MHSINDIVSIVEPSVHTDLENAIHNKTEALKIVLQLKLQNMPSVLKVVMVVGSR